MSFNVTFQNIGKLDHADIRIGQFTILAGPNNTGKSTVSKLLYSVFDGMNANHAVSHFYNLTHSIRTAYNSPVWWLPENEPHPLAFIDETLIKMDSLISGIEMDNVKQMESILPDIRTFADTLYQHYIKKQPDIWAAWEQSDQESKSYMESVFQRLEEDLHNLCRNLNVETGTTFVVGGLREKIQANLAQNFQVSDLSSLQGTRPTPSTITIEGVATFHLTDGQSRVGDLTFSNMARLQQYSRVLYLESPNYWKLQGPLEIVKAHPRFYYSPHRQRLSGVPRYVYDLFRAVQDKYAGEIPLGSIAEKLTSAMNGKLVLSETGEIQFHENDSVFPLSMTAMGVVNLGMLALLIERRILDEGTVLFIDEPETNLHPAWQHLMAEALFKLASHGVIVVIATHSPDILKWVATHLKNHPDEKPLVAVNRFPFHPEDESLEYKLAMIQGELTDAYTQKYFEGL